MENAHSSHENRASASVVAEVPLRQSMVCMRTVSRREFTLKNYQIDKVSKMYVVH